MRLSAELQIGERRIPVITSDPSAKVSLTKLGGSDVGFWIDHEEDALANACPRCGARLRYVPPESAWHSQRLGKDVGFVRGCFYVVSSRFVEWIIKEGIHGAILTQIGSDMFFLDAVQVELDLTSSGGVAQGRQCAVCGLPAGIGFPWQAGKAPIPNIEWPYGDQRVLARSRLLKGEMRLAFPDFYLPTDLKKSFKKERMVAGTFMPAIGSLMPTEVVAPESVIHRRSVPVSPGKGRSAPPEAVLAPLLALLAHPAPAFVCRNADGRSPAAPIALRHTAQPAATPEDVEAARKLLGKRAALYLELFSRHDGVRLYEEPVHGEPGVALCPMRDWPVLTQQCREALPPDEPMDGLRAKDPFVAIGQAESAGAYLVVMTRGALAGQVRVVQPADWSVSVLATNLAELVDALCDPVPLIQNSLGQSLRYSDGIRRGEYFPVEYLPDAKAKPAS